MCITKIPPSKGIEAVVMGTATAFILLSFSFANDFHLCYKRKYLTCLMNKAIFTEAKETNYGITYKKIPRSTWR